jgi:hypothetical protein
MVYVSCAAEWGGGKRDKREEAFLWSLDCVTTFHTTDLLHTQKETSMLLCKGTLVQSLSIEKDRAVLYSDFVTILRMVSMQYITKLVTSQSQKPRSPLNKNIK